MRHVIAWSGGKDSTATILLFLLHWKEIVKKGDKVTILYAEVMYDLARNISGELPQIVEFIHNTVEWLKKQGFEVEIVRSKDKDFLTFFHHIIKRKGTHPEHVGMKYGFPISGRCGVKRDCKEKPIKDWYKAHKGEEIMEYVGIAIDEKNKNRLPALHKKKNAVSLLEKYEYTEAMALELCRQYKLVSPQYTLNDGKQKRGGCWFCPNAKDCESRAVMEIMPDVWDEYVALEDVPNVAFDKWNPYSKETLHERDIRLKNEAEQTSIFDIWKDVV